MLFAVAIIITNDFLHKLSKSLVEDCGKKEIKVILAKPMIVSVCVK